MQDLRRGPRKPDYFLSLYQNLASFIQCCFCRYSEIKSDEAIEVCTQVLAKADEASNVSPGQVPVVRPLRG